MTLVAAPTFPLWGSLAITLARWGRPAPLPSRALVLAARAPGQDARSDEELVSAAVGGEGGAYDELYRRHVDLVWRRLTHLLGPDPEREDLTQQIFLEVFGRLDRFRGEARFRSFLWRVAVNTAIDHLEHRRRRPLPLAAEAFELVRDAGASPEERVQERQAIALVWSLLDGIKPKKRVAFVLRVIEGLPLEEVAVLVGSNVAAVAKRVRHAQDELEALLARREVR
jgi:RNA polymerase sigma factor (sigma-70 family)